MSLWTIAGFAALTGIAALLLAQRLRRRLAALTQSYLELRYEYHPAPIRRRAARRPAARRSPETAERQRQAQTSFLPLSSLKPKT